MKHFKTSFSEVICGNIRIPASLRIGLISDSSNIDYPLIHNQAVQISAGSSFTTASSEITKNIPVDKYVIYCDQESGTCGPWIVENSIQVKIYETKNNTLLAQKTIGRLDDISIMPSDSLYEHPSIILEPCSPSINLEGLSLRIEFNSLCDSGSNPCCDHLPENVSVSGYDVLCLPLTDFYVVPPDPITTTTPAPVVVNRTIIDRQPTIKTSDDIDYYRVESDISIIGGSSFTYWWERKEEGTDWVRHTDLQESLSNKTVFIREPKEKDYYYRLLLIEPNKIYSDSIFFDFPDPTTTTTTTLPPKYFEPPNAVTNVESSGDFRKVFLSWEPPIYDGNSDITGYHIIGKLPEVGKFWNRETTIVNTGVEPSVTSYFQPVSFEYDGVDILYSVFSKNYFGIKGSSVVLGHNSVLGKTVSNDPPTILNFSLFPFRTSSGRGYNLDWEAFSSPDQPLLSHVIKYRPSGSNQDYVTDTYSDVETSVSITGPFSSCEQYEFTVEGVNEVGNGVAATGYSLMAFPPSAPTGVSYTLLDGEPNSFVEMSGSWYLPLDDGFCPVSDYVFSYRLLPDGDFTDPIKTNNLLSFKTSDTIPSGDYELKVAAVTKFEVIHHTVEGVPIVVDSIYNTGVYGFYNPNTVFIYNFESWRLLDEDDISYRNITNLENGQEVTRSFYPYWPSGSQITEDIGPRNLPAKLSTGQNGIKSSEDYVGGFTDYNLNVSKFGNSGLYLSEYEFACPKDNYREIQEQVGEEWEISYIYGWKYLEGVQIYDQGYSEDILAPPVPLHKDGKTAFTFEFWFKLRENYQSDWESGQFDIVNLCELICAHTKDFTSTFPFNGNESYSYSHTGDTGTGDGSSIYNILIPYSDNERHAYTKFSIRGQYVPSLGFRLIYNDQTSVKDLRRIDSSAPDDAVPREVETIFQSVQNPYFNIINPETSNEFLVSFSNLPTSHGLDLRGMDIPTSVYLNDEDWHHIALSVDAEGSNFVTMYLDGAEVFTHNPTLHITVKHDGVGGNDVFHGIQTIPNDKYSYLGSDYDPALGYGTFTLGIDHYSIEYDDPQNSAHSHCAYYDDVRLSAAIIYDGEFDPPTSAHTG